jgi:hypothetical protein
VRPPVRSRGHDPVRLKHCPRSGTTCTSPICGDPPADATSAQHALTGDGPALPAVRSAAITTQVVTGSGSGPGHARRGQRRQVPDERSRSATRARSRRSRTTTGAGRGCREPRRAVRPGRGTCASGPRAGRAARWPARAALHGSRNLLPMLLQGRLGSGRAPPPAAARRQTGQPKPGTGIRLATAAVVCAVAAFAAVVTPTSVRAGPGQDGTAAAAPLSADGLIWPPARAAPGPQPGRAARFMWLASTAIGANIASAGIRAARR